MLILELARVIFSPYLEECLGCIDQQEELTASLVAVACVEVMLQRDWSLQGADHIDVLPFDSPARWITLISILRGRT